MSAKVKVCALLFAATFAASAALSQPQSQNSADQRALQSLDNAYRSVVTADADPTAADKSLKLIHRVIDRIARSFIEPFGVRELANYSSSAIRRYPAGTQAKDLADAAIHEMVVRLGDPYATFDERRMRRKGKRISGIGIEATILDGRLKVIAPLEGSPAQKAGVEPGDIIVEIDREEIDGLTLKEAMDRIRGPIGTEVLLRIQRNGARKLGLPVPRARFRVREVRHARFGDIAYIRVAFFGPDTEKLLRKALGAIKKEMGGAKPSGYIIDIRNNPGGLVGQAILLADAFLEQGMIVATTGRHAKGSRRYDAYRGDFVNGSPILILQNEASASASEILAAALKDNRRATIMGTRSYGKGIVQTRFPVGAQGQIKFTTHKFMTAAGIQIHEVGVLPDIVVNGDPRPTYGAAATSIDRCPTAGKARDRMLGCAILFMNKGRSIDSFLQALPELK